MLYGFLIFTVSAVVITIPLLVIMPGFIWGVKCNIDTVTSSPSSVTGGRAGYAGIKVAYVYVAKAMAKGI